MKKTQRIVMFVLAGVLTAGAGGAAAWYALQQQGGGDAAPQRKPVSDKDAPRYVSLEKVIVMLRREAGDNVSHYLAVDLVFKTPHDQEKATKDQLPLLRSVAVRALASLNPAQAGAMSVDEIAAQIEKAYDESYAADQRDKPFSDVMIGKLIIE